MSADNWGICPKCAANTIRIKDNMKKQVDDAYGKVSSDEYLKLLKKASEPIKQEYTLREDYEIYTNEYGKFCVSYGCSCNVCGFEYDYEYTENIFVNDD